MLHKNLTGLKRKTVFQYDGVIGPNSFPMHVSDFIFGKLIIHIYLLLTTHFYLFCKQYHLHEKSSKLIQTRNKFQIK